MHDSIFIGKQHTKYAKEVELLPRIHINIYGSSYNRTHPLEQERK